ncbi:nucleotide sugar dehydrogenase [Candidatus Poribacteria bacterium]|nr:nucleotide sugar dehydrogenase [Candidatus Poribacteria bacterium]
MLLKKIETRSAHAGVIGLGYVGLSLVVAIADAGFKVTGIDINPEKIERLKRGISDVPDVPDAVLGPLIKSGQIQVTTDYSVLSQLDTVNICVPTPLNENRTPDMQFITAAVEQIAQHLHSEQLVILESTTYPGTTEEIVLPTLQPNSSETTLENDSNTKPPSLSPDSTESLQVGRDFYLAFSPERIEPGNSTYFMTNTPKIVGGVTPKCTQVAKTFYEQFINKTYTVSSPRIAEMTKLLENTFRSVNIGLINEVALICDRMDLNVWEIIDAAATKPFGFMPFYPGPGLGGHCIPIDPHYLSWQALNYNYHARFIELASEINSSMPNYVLDKVIHALNLHRKPLNGSNLLILGVAYKKDIGDTRESPAFEVIRLMLDKGAHILYHDPHVSNIVLGEGGTYHSQTLTSALIESVDCVVILTDHSAIDYDLIVKHAAVIVDTRNATRTVQNELDKIIKI